jgi:hypothetical protein
VNPGDHNTPSTTRDAALARVLAYRERGRARPMPIRATLILLGGVLLVVCIPLHDWFHRQPRLARVAILIGLLLAAAALVWLTRSYGS